RGPDHRRRLRRDRAGRPRLRPAPARVAHRGGTGGAAAPLARGGRGPPAPVRGMEGGRRRGPGVAGWTAGWTGPRGAVRGKGAWRRAPAARAGDSREGTVTARRSGR